MQESHGSHLTTAVCYREIETEELSPLFDWSSENSGFNELLAHFSTWIMLENKAKHIANWSQSQQCEGPPQQERSRSRRHKYNVIVSRAFCMLHPWAQRALSTRPCEWAHLPPGPGSAQRGQKCVDISIGGATQTHKLWPHLTQEWWATTEESNV